MPFPESDRVAYRNPQLEEVICQLRFPPILSIGVKDPAGFQDRVRDVYPEYERDEGVSGAPKEVAGLLTRLAGSAIPSELLTYRFRSGDGKVISLANSFVAISFGENRYKTWQEFSQELDRAKEAIEEEYKPSYYTRIGLRYRDVISRERLQLADVPWNELIRTEILGTLADDVIGPHILGIRSEVVFSLDEIPGGSGKLRNGLVDKRNTDGSTEVVYLLDLDLYAEGEVKGADVRGILDRFNRHAGNFFRWAITARLAEALGPIPVDG